MPPYCLQVAPTALICNDFRTPLPPRNMHIGRSNRCRESQNFRERKLTFAAAPLLSALPTLAMGGDAEGVANKARTVS